MEKAHEQPICFGVDKQWCNSRFSFAQQTFNFSMRTNPKGNPNGLGNNSRVFGSQSTQGDSTFRSQTFNPLVYNPKRGKTQVDNRLQGNQPFFAAQTIQTGKLVRKFSLSEKRHVGSQNRPPTCLFSSGHSREAKTFHLHSNGTKSFPVPSSLFWHEHTSGIMAKRNESFSQKMEKSRPNVLGLLGRHFSRGTVPKSSAKTFGHDAPRLGTFRHGGQQKEMTTGTHSASRAFGFFGGSEKWNFARTQRKNESHQKTTWKASNAQGNVHQKDGSHFGSHKSIFNGNAFSTSFCGSAGPIRKPAGNPWMGQKIAHTFNFESTSKGNGLPNAGMERQKFSGKNSSTGASFRLIPGGLGRSGCKNRLYRPIILQGQKGPPDQCKRVGGSNTVKSLAHQGEHVCLKVDNSVTFWYLQKGGGRIPSLNGMIRPFIKWCMDKHITLQVLQAKSSEDLADGPSRWGKDRGYYTLDRALFQVLRQRMCKHIKPRVDMFAISKALLQGESPMLFLAEN